MSFQQSWGRIEAEKLTDNLSVLRANAINLPYPEERFELVFNEAILTIDRSLWLTFIFISVLA
ncbi:MAG: hypothetical protein Q4P08_04985 [Eubacteriales bacterium]|nr:hypothetical protein [Eubacteriales bacterium]